MTVYEALTLMLTFGALLISLISLVIAVIMAILKDNTKK